MRRVEYSDPKPILTWQCVTRSPAICRHTMTMSMNDEHTWRHDPENTFDFRSKTKRIWCYDPQRKKPWTPEPAQRPQSCAALPRNFWHQLPTISPVTRSKTQQQAQPLVWVRGRIFLRENRQARPMSKQNGTTALQRTDPTLIRRTATEKW